jgi:hypothetical protein
MKFLILQTFKIYNKLAIINKKILETNLQIWFLLEEVILFIKKRMKK